MFAASMLAPMLGPMLGGIIPGMGGGGAPAQQAYPMVQPEPQIIYVNGPEAPPAPDNSMMYMMFGGALILVVLLKK